MLLGKVVLDKLLSFPFKPQLYQARFQTSLTEDLGAGAFPLFLAAGEYLLFYVSLFLHLSSWLTWVFQELEDIF